MGTISTLNDIKKGVNLNIDGQPYSVTDANFVRMQQRQPVMQTKLKNLVDGKVLEKTFKPGDKVEYADLQRGKANYMYKDDENAYFMNNETYEQFDLPLDQLGNKINYLKEGTDCDVLYFEDQPVNVDIPIKVKLKVTQAPPGIKGDSSSNVTKQITLETGAVINAPLFINQGDEIIVNTEKEEYIERAK
ncbi:MAG: elongation factor P [Candidatus Buchananbacteria bacterium]|nr:elongation factor P [Candidatus Buchananbacteria bacterium]